MDGYEMDYAFAFGNAGLKANHILKRFTSQMNSHTKEIKNQC